MSKEYKELPKAYDSKGVEDNIYKDWETGELFKPDMSREDSFMIAMPPPNATGTLHLGHATMLAFEDCMTRYNRMLGKSTLWLPGTDHAAIATQSVVEKKLQAEGIEKPREILGREKLLEEIKKFVKNSKSTIRNQVRKMGASCDWTREKYTLDDDLNHAVNTLFENMYEDGLIYSGNRIVNWDPNMNTTVADDEVEYIEERTKFYYFQYGPVIIGTSRPETKFLDKVIVVHPDDERYKDLIGKEFDVEWIEGTVKAKVIADSCIDMELGTGAMTITPAHSMVDFEIAQKHDFKIEQIIDLKGNIIDSISKDFGGLSIKEARKKIVERLEEKGLLVEVDEKYIHKKAVNYRGKGVLEPQVMKQWFIDVNKKVIDWKGDKCSIKEVLQDVVRSNMIKLYPSRFEKIYFGWIDNLRDWCISRQIWWGHQIPIWYELEKEDYDGLISKKQISSFDIQAVGYIGEPVCSNEKPLNSGYWLRDPDTLDTWFSSALWTFSSLGWPEHTEDFKKFHPTAVMETGYDIIFFWVARMILASTYALRRDGLSEEQSIPFKDVYLHGLIKDKHGKKMSKSSPETCIDPLDMIKKYGADALRLSLMIGSSPGNDMKLYEEKIAGYRNFINKIWNISRYIMMSTDQSNSEVIPKTQADFWILKRLDEVIEDVTNYLSNYLFSQAGERVYEFLWNDFADWYIEVSKIEKGKDAILRFVLAQSLKLLHPFVPFVTEHIWEMGEFSDKKLIVEEWPEIGNEKYDNSGFEQTRKLISKIRSERAYFKIEPKKFLKIVVKSNDMLEGEAVIKGLARLSEVSYDSDYNSNKGDVLITEGNIELYLVLAEHIDISEMLTKLNIDIEHFNKLLYSATKKLSNKRFIDSAPKDIVETEIQKKETLTYDINRLKERIHQLS